MLLQALPSGQGLGRPPGWVTPETSLGWPLRLLCPGQEDHLSGLGLETPDLMWPSWERLMGVTSHGLLTGLAKH